jgi:methyltransferase (TIGR00027 family)
MEKEKPSLSAAGVAGFRAIEAQKPESERIFFDPYAHVFVPGGIAWPLSKWMIESGLYERMAPGAAAFILLRERTIDDFLKEKLSEGLEQVVIRGAGYDPRAYRTPGVKKTRLFEVDHPATQNRKLELLKKVIAPIPGFVTFVPVDFNSQEFGERLQNMGYDEHARTAFIWQGVTYFLTREGVDRTLAFIVGHSAPGSSVIFDYMYSEIFRDESRSDIKALRRAARISGEAYLFGIERGQIDQFLHQRGFQDVQNFTLEDLKQKYFTGKNALRVVPTGYAVASAKVVKARK